MNPHTAAASAMVETLLNCWVRETGTPRGAKPGIVKLRLERLDMDLTGHLVAWSPTGRHRWTGCGLGGVTLDPVTLAALLVREAGGAGDVADLVVRVADSVTRTATFLDARAREPCDTIRSFLDAEQALVLGHPLHPTPKSRTGFTTEECRRYSPELRGCFPLRWFSVDRDLVAEDSALDLSATALLAQLVDVDPGPDRALLPVHPWQARNLLAQPYVDTLLGEGLLRDLGELGRPWHPTSSVRTLYRPDVVMMLKCSLALPITNSVRINYRKELVRGVEVHRLLHTRLGHELRARFPDFDIVRDPAWATVEPATGEQESGFELVLRDNPWQHGDTEAACVAALCADRPDRNARAWMLTEIVRGLACAENRAPDEVARDWWARYLDVAARPLIWLYAAHGIALEAHQQNSVVVLENGWPAEFRYRDNQGYYFANSTAERLGRLLPGLGAHSDVICEDALADERFGYYLGINHLLGMIGAFGAAELADEMDLLAELKGFCEGVAAALPRVPGMLETLIDAPTLRCKANFLTRVEGLDELVGPVETQSVYVDIPNPLREVSRVRRGRGRDRPVQPGARRPARPRRGRRRGLL